MMVTAIAVGVSGGGAAEAPGPASRMQPESTTANRRSTARARNMVDLPPEMDSIVRRRAARPVTPRRRVSGALAVLGPPHADAGGLAGHQDHQRPSADGPPGLVADPGRHGTAPGRRQRTGDLAQGARRGGAAGSGMTQPVHRVAGVLDLLLARR